jgi:hypothetical protein
MLQKTGGLLIYELGHHVPENCADSVKALIRLADVGKPHIIHENLLDDENCDGFRKLASSLHDIQAKQGETKGTPRRI